jgi:hypothetical protein
VRRALKDCKALKATKDLKVQWVPEALTARRAQMGHVENRALKVRKETSAR